MGIEEGGEGRGGEVEEGESEALHKNRIGI